MRKHLKRRTFLRGALGGGIATIALPPLDAMLNLEQTAFADGSSQPRRYVSWFYGNGFTYVLSHMGPHLSSHGPLEKGIGDVRRIFSGEIHFAEELMSFEV